MPLEVEHGNETTSYIMQSGVVGHFVFEQLDKNRWHTNFHLAGHDFDADFFNGKVVRAQMG